MSCVAFIRADTINEFYHIQTTKLHRTDTKNYFIKKTTQYYEFLRGGIYINMVNVFSHLDFFAKTNSQNK